MENIMKKMRRILAVSVALVILVSVVPLNNGINTNIAIRKVKAETTLSNPIIVGNPDDDPDHQGYSEQIVTWDCLWFGMYPQSEVNTSDQIYKVLNKLPDSAWDTNNDTSINGVKYRRFKGEDAPRTGTNDYYYNWNDDYQTYHYFKYEPIKWRILNINSQDAFLMSDKVLDSQIYHAQDGKKLWEDSTLRSWLNGLDESNNSKNEDYSENNFIDCAFSIKEKRAIQTTNNSNYHRLYPGNDTKDKIFVLSDFELSNEKGASYGFVRQGLRDEARWRKCSTYAWSRGIMRHQADVNGEHINTVIDNVRYWSRTPGNQTFSESTVDELGYVISGWRSDVTGVGVCPALYINLSDTSAYSYAGTVSSSGAVNEVEPPDRSDIEQGNPFAGGDLQCSKSFSLETGEYRYLTPKAFSDNLDSLKSLISDITWTSSDESIAIVSKGGFTLPVAPTAYETEQGFYMTWMSHGLLRIGGRKAGTAMITGRSSDGTTVSCEVTVVEPPDSGKEGVGNGGSLTLGEDISGSADEDSGVLEFFPGNWSLKSALFPVEISIKEDPKTHNYTVRGTVGIGKANWLDDDSKWSKYKKNVSDANKYTGRVDCLEKYADAWGVKSMTSVTTDKFNVLPKLSVMGYIENTYDKNWNLISGTGKLAADAKWEGSINWQFITPIGPLYLNLKGSGALSGNLGPKYNYDEKKLEIIDGSLTLTPSVALEGGYGIDKVATVGAEGRLSLPISLIPATKGDLEAKAALNVNLVFVIDYSHDLAKLTVPLWDTTTTNKLRSKSIQARKGTEFSVGTFTEIDTSSLNDASAWNTGNRQTAKARTRSVATDTEVTLLDGVLGGSLPMQAEVAGKRVVVFQSYDGNRTTLNSPILMYSVYENNAWSEPKAVWDTGTADMYADMKVVDGKLALVWQKEKAETTGNVTNDSENVLKQIAQNSEICFSVFDEETNTFSDPAYVTNNDSCDMMPRICDNSDEIVLSWVRNDAADLMQEKGLNKIYTVAWNGTAFDAETELVKASGTVDDYVLYKNGDEVEAVFVGQSNGMTAMFDTDGRVIEELSDLFMFSEDGSISSIQYVDGQVVCVSNGTLYAYDPADKTVETYQAGESAFGSEIQHASNGGKSGYVWSLYDEETDTGSIVASMKTEDGYSEPVTLYEKEGVIWRYVSPIIDEDGNWQFVTNAEDAGDGTHSLISIVKAPKTGVALAGASVDENDIVNGETGVDYFLTNTGDTPITELELTITLADGKTITKKVPVNIQPGEDAVGTAYVDLSDVDSQQKAQISISEKGQTDTEGCTAEDTIGLPDISVTGNMVEDGENVQVTAVLSNEGTVDAETSLVLFGDETQKAELDRKDKIVLKAKEKQSISFTIPKDKIVYNENDAAYLTIKAESDGGDYDESNNIAYVVLYKEKTPGANPDDTTENPGGNVTPPTGNTGTSSPVSGNTGSTGQSQTGPVQNTNGRVLPVGTMLTDSRTNACYVVTEAGQSVAYVKNLNKKSISAIVPSNITFGNITYKVTSITANAFSGCKKLKSVTIGNNVTTIGNNAFKKCTSLKKVIIPARVTTIGKNAFAGCKKLKNVIVKTKVLKKIGKNAFKGINKAAKIKVPKKKLTGYKKLFKKAKLAKSIRITR